MTRFALTKILSIAAFTSLFTVSDASAVVYASNGNTGFGGVLGSLEITDDGTTITATLTRGAGALNDGFILYIDSIGGGSANTANFTDTADDLRRGISGFDGTNRATLNFPGGFGADRALGLNSGFAGLWATVEGGSHTFLTTANGAPGGATQATYAMTFSIADLGINPGDSFNFVGTYLNTSNAFRSDEAFGGGIGPGNPGVPSTATFSSFLTYTTVPEPSVFALFGILGFALIFRRRR